MIALCRESLRQRNHYDSSRFTVLALDVALELEGIQLSKHYLRKTNPAPNLLAVVITQFYKTIIWARNSYS